MEPVEYRSVIKFLPLRGNFSSDTFQEMVQEHCIKCPRCIIAAYWKRKLKQRFMSVTDEENGMSVGSIESIIHNHLNMYKVPARYASRLLTGKQKKQRVKSCKTLFRTKSNGIYYFFENMVTLDETWIHHFDPKQKIFSIKW